MRNAIQSCLLFSNLSESQCDEIASISSESAYKKRDIIFTEGDCANALYILMSGQVNLIKYNSDGNEKLIRRVMPGEIFAEAAMFSGINYPVTAIMIQSGNIIAIQKQPFLKMIKENPDISMSLLGVMSKLLRHYNEMLSALSLTQAINRLALYIMQQSKLQKTDCILLPMSKKELSKNLGVQPETLSRNLALLSQKKIISVNQKKITIHQKNKLNAFAV